MSDSGQDAVDHRGDIVGVSLETFSPMGCELTCHKCSNSKHLIQNAYELNIKDIGDGCQPSHILALLNSIC